MARRARGAARRPSDDTDIVADRFTVRPAWAEVHDGRAARLSPTETIEMTRVGRFGDTDPVAVVVGWRSIGRFLGVGVVAASVGVQWWRGASRGTGPFGMLGDR